MVKQPDESKLPKWIKVSKQRFDVITKKVQNAKNKNFPTRLNRSKIINFNKSKKLLCDIENSKITYQETLERMENICSDVNKIISMWSLNSNQIHVINIIFMANEIFSGET